jgi:5-methylcytosine-specific restriction endonuclease McrA
MKPPTFRPAGAPTRKQQNDAYEQRRRASKPWRKRYYSQRWLALRASHLGRQPLCQHCYEQHPQRITAAEVVHHIVAHNGDEALFYDQNNLASLCTDCHDGPIQELEKRGNPWVPRGATEKSGAIEIHTGAPAAKTFA